MEKWISIIMELPQMQMEAGIVNAEKWILAIAESIRILQEKHTI